MKKLIPLSVFTSMLLFGAGYKLPQQSINSTALAAAYVSHTTAADAAYYNPANMAFMDDGESVEFSLMGLHLTAQKSAATGHESEKEYFLLPQLHLVSEAMGNWRIGFSLVVPGGLTKRWQSPPESFSAKKTQLKLYELNPSVSYKVTDTFAIAGGVRFIYSSADLESDPVPAALKPPVGSPGTIIEADKWNLGYNLALSYKPMKEWGFAATYRSKVDLDMDGEIRFPSGFSALGMPPGFETPGNASVPLPATLCIATDYTFNETTTVELVFERAFWSAYKSMTINAQNLPGGKLVDIEKNWKDSSTYRIGITHLFNDQWTGMLGYAFDETPVPDETLGYELPDSDGNVFSLGFRYKVNEDLELGLAYLVDFYKDRTVANTNVGITEFTGSKAHMLTFGVGYKF